MTWLAITTEPGKARIVRRRLRRDGINAYLPAIVKKKNRVRYKQNGEPFFRNVRDPIPLMSYVLVEEPREFAVRHLMLVHVLNVRDVSGALGIPGLGPSIIPNSEVDDMKARVKQIIFEVQVEQHKEKLRKGRRARVKSGHAAGKTGTVSWINKKRAELDMMIEGVGMRRIAIKLEDLEAA